MKATTGIAIACLSALTFAYCAETVMSAQTPAPVAPQSGTTNQDSTNDLSLAVGKSVVLDLARPVTRIVVGLGDFAQAQAVSPTQILLSGKAAGETSLIVWDQSGGRQFFNVTVRPSTFSATDQLEGVRRELRAELPGQSVKVSLDNGMVFLRGTVNNLNSSERAVTIASTAGKVVNLLNVNVPAPEPQILLKVKFASIDRNKSKQLGINLFSTGFGNTIGSISTGQFSPPGITLRATGLRLRTLAIPSNSLPSIPGINLGATVSALESQRPGRGPCRTKHRCQERASGQLPCRRRVSLPGSPIVGNGRLGTHHDLLQGIRRCACLHSDHYDTWNNSPSSGAGGQCP